MGKYVFLIIIVIAPLYNHTYGLNAIKGLYNRMCKTNNISYYDDAEYNINIIHEPEKNNTADASTDLHDKQEKEYPADDDVFSYYYHDNDEEDEIEALNSEDDSQYSNCICHSLSKPHPFLEESYKMTNTKILKAQQPWRHRCMQIVSDFCKQITTYIKN